MPPSKIMPALSMSQTKEDLLKYLGMRAEIYAMMAKETDTAYKWLTTGTQHLKSNCTRDPPYDWSDITELSKEQAMIRLAASGDSYTSPYWYCGSEMTADGCPNWIARWFLYHKFRYRDGRNRGKESKSSPRSNGNKGRTKSNTPKGMHNYHQITKGSLAQSGRESYPLASPVHQNSYSSANSIAVSSWLTNNTSSIAAQPATFYDPVKGLWIPKD